MMVGVLDWFATRFEELEQWADDRFGPDSPRARTTLIGGLVAVIATGISAVFLVGWMLITIVNAVLSSLSQGVVVVLQSRLTEVITQPVQAYLSAHAKALPTGADEIGTAVMLSGLIVWALCVFFRSRIAQLGWILYGIAVTAMVYAGSPPDGRWLAAGVALLYWVGLSLPALAGIGRRPHTVVNIHPDPRPAREAVDQLQEHLAETRTRVDRLESAGVAQLHEDLAETRTRVDRLEAAGDELAARRTGGKRDPGEGED
ncbi:hypothetical protein SAMN05216276_10865 [Streptosporangium subroseum]|uniref:Uncharacterized protein n=1 Tax=Streptosporangium subroseum TaxID=106412 RepID=A0A239P5D4_9ACTN|nr:hypothetical protein [Streptosporangium subroseum]SNT61874.1 hypothetical protein SAMN05216276_10865 [Streptosporangium subroseum]